jgi:hypothetical protein
MTGRHALLETLPVRLRQFPDGRLDTRNAAAYLGFSRRTLGNWRGQGTGPKYIVIHGRVFYYKADLDAWLEQFHRVRSTAQAQLAIVPKG